MTKYVLDEEHRFLLNTQMEKHMSNNSPEQAYECKKAIQEIEIPKEFHKQWEYMLRTYDATLHLINVLNMALTEEDKQYAISKYVKSLSLKEIPDLNNLNEKIKEIERFFETPIAESRENAPIVYEFEEQLLSKRFFRNNGIYRSQLNSLPELVNLAYNWTQHKSEPTLSFCVPNMDIEKFVINKQALFGNFLASLTKNNIITYEFLSDDIEKLGHILTRSLPYGYKYPDAIEQNFKIHVLVDRINGFIDKNMSNSLVLAQWVNVKFWRRDEKEQIITKLPDRTWTYMFFGLLKMNKIEEVWDSLENKTLHSPRELIEISKSNLIPHVFSAPANKLMTEYMIFASHLKDLMLLSEKYAKTPIVFDIGKYEPILIGGKLPVKLNLTPTGFAPEIVGMKRERER